MEALLGDRLIDFLSLFSNSTTSNDTFDVKFKIPYHST